METDYTDQSWISLLMVFLLLIPIKPVIFMKTEKSNYFTTSVMFLAWAIAVGCQLHWKNKAGISDDIWDMFLCCVGHLQPDVEDDKW